MKVGLVLEGGASKGIFTAGVLDYWMEKEVFFPYVVSVSAGTCNALDYLSGQVERTKECMLPTSGEQYYGVKRLIRTGHFMDMDMLFHEYPVKQHPFDVDSYFQSPIQNEIVVTNCKNGKAEYLEEKEDFHQLMLKSKASCSMPIFAPIVEVEDGLYLDGGMADSIPFERAFYEGCDKVVIIMTHNEDYIPSISNKVKRLFRRKYKQYPELVETLCNRPVMYEKQVKRMKKAVDDNKALVIRPEMKAVHRLERSVEKMQAFYDHGYEIGKESYEELMEFLNV